MWTICIPGASRGQKVLGSLEMELQRAVSCHAGVENQTCVLCKSSKYSQPAQNVCGLRAQNLWKLVLVRNKNKDQGLKSGTVVTAIWKCKCALDCTKTDEF